MVLMCRMTFILPIVAGKGAWPSTRATGTLPAIAQSPECCWTIFCLVMIFSENRIPLFGIMHLVQANEMRLHLESHDLIGKPEPLFRTMRKNARDMRA